MAAWLWAGRWKLLDRDSPFMSSEMTDDHISPAAEWKRDLLGRFPEDPQQRGSGVRCNPYQGNFNSRAGGDQFHLSQHVLTPLEGDTPSYQLYRTKPSERKGIVIVDQLRGWYRALEDAGESLPDIGPRSWYIDVFSKPVGHLGTYRKSRSTGIWFSGRHHYHQQGN